jgi:ribosome maturation factor RimP
VLLPNPHFVLSDKVGSQGPLFYCLELFMTGIDPIQRAESLLQPILHSMGLELVDLELKKVGRGQVLRVFIDKPGGVNLDDCAEVSRELSVQLDVEDCISSRYTLEVSSPGLNRPLKNEQDFVRYQGRLAVIKTAELLKDEKGSPRKTFLGIIDGVEDGIIAVRLKEGPVARIPWDKIAKAHLEFEF